MSRARGLAATALVTTVLVSMTGGCSSGTRTLDCDTTTGAFVDYTEDARGASTLDEVVDDYSSGGDTVEVAERFDSQAVLLVRRDDRTIARLMVEDFGSGWLVSSSQYCDDTPVDIR